MARLLAPRSGVALLDGLRVADLVGPGRHPHHSWLRRWSAVNGEQAVLEAVRATGVADLAETEVLRTRGVQFGGARVVDLEVKRGWP